MMSYGSGYNTRFVSNEDIVAYLKKTFEAIEFVHREVVKSNQTRGFAQAGLTAVIAQAYFTQNHEVLIEFGDVVISGEIHRTPGSTAPLLLRDFLLRPGMGQRLTQVSIYRKTQTALEAFIRNNTLKELVESTHQFFPLPTELVVTPPTTNSTERT